MKAIILAGGLGTRLKPFTEVIPKPLLPIGEKSVLEIQIGRLKKYGFDEIYLATNYKSEYIGNFFGDGSRYNVKLIISKEDKPLDHTYDIVGSLCENNDKFAIDRKLPEIEIGDIIVIHDAGAHGHAMGFNYNGKLRSTELLLKEDGSVVQIRRAETVDDYFATLDFSNL